MEKFSSSKIIEKSGKLSVKVVRELEELAEYADRWNLLALSAPQQLPMLSYNWVASYLEHLLEPEESWFCLMVLEDNKLVGVLPLITTPHRLMGFNRPLLRTPFNQHTRSVDILTEAGSESEIIPLLVSSIERVVPARYGLELLRLPESSPTLAVADNGLERTCVIKEFNGEGAFLKTEGNFEEYWSSLAKKFRTNVRNCNNKLSKLSGLKTVFRSGSEASAGDLEILMELEASSWKGRTRTAIKLNPVLVSFYTALTGRMAESGWLEWHFLEVEGKTIAGNLALKFGRSLVGLKLGYDEAYAKCSPSTVLLERAIKRAFDSPDIDELNMLSDSSWFKNWGVEKRSYYDLWIYPRNLLPLTFGVLPKKARKWGSRIPGLRPLYRRVRSLRQD